MVLGWNIAWLAILLQTTKKYGGVDKVLEAINNYGPMMELKAELDGVKRKLLDAEASAGKKPPETRVVETVPLMYWGRREIEAALIGVLSGLNEYVQESPDLPDEVKTLIEEHVSELLKALDSHRIEGEGSSEVDDDPGSSTQGGEPPSTGNEIRPVSNQLPRTSAYHVDYEALNRVTPDTRLLIYRRVLNFDDPSRVNINQISESIHMEVGIVSNLLNYLITDPVARYELRGLGYTDVQVPGWVAAEKK